MVTIDANQSVCTVITKVLVSPADHEEIFEHLQSVVENVISKQAGYISSSLHLSDDTKAITHYAQWRSLDDYQLMKRNMEVQENLQQALAAAQSQDEQIYHIIWQHACETVAI